jgi:hypothetical protein
VRVQRQSATEPRLRVRFVTEAAFHHAAVEELRGVEGPEPQCTLRVVERVRTPAIADKSPGQHVVTVDGRSFMVCGPCERECLR